MHNVCVAIWLLVIVSIASGLPDGSPATNEVCENLIPDHGVDPQPGPAPFRIEANLIDGNRVNVRLLSTGNEKFRGFIIQPRFINDGVVFNGIFSENSDTKNIDCFASPGNTLTHTNREEKSVVSTTWTPKSFSKDQFVFRATVVKSYDEIYANVASNPINL